MKILIVDDDRSNIVLLETLLKRSGYEVKSSDNGKNALKKLQSQSFDLIISDILMPVMDGFQLCHKCKENERLKDIPFIFYSATYTDTKDEKLALAIGAEKFIRKPIDPEKFLEQINMIFERDENNKPKKLLVKKHDDVYKLYNEQLVTKLEKKMRDLEQEIITRKKTEQQLRDSEEKYRMLFEESLDGINLQTISTKNKPGRFIEFNGVYCKMLGYTHEELKEQKSMDSVPHENINDVLAIKDKLLREKKALFETTLKRKDSSRIPVEIYAHLIDYEGQPAVLSIVRDITKRKQIENELKKEKKYLEKLLNSLGEAIFTVKMPERIIQAVNDSCQIILGAKPADCIGKRTEVFFPDRDGYLEFEKKLEKIIEQKKEKLNTNQLLKRKNGEVFPAEIITSFLKENGKITHVISIVRDITYQVKTEKALKDSEKNFRALAENANDGIMIAVEEGNHIYANKRAADITGYSVKELLTMNIENLIHSDDIEKVMGRFRRRLEGKPANSQYEFVGVRKDGTKFPVEITAARTLWQNQPAILVMFRDITKRKQAEENIKKSENTLRNLAIQLQKIREEERTIIAREIHDELGQSLTALKMDIVWLKRKIPGELTKQQEKLTTMSELVDATIGTVKKISTDLRPGLLDDLGLIPAIEWQLAEFKKRTNIDFNLNIDPEEIYIDQERSTALFRIFQETLTNIVRHADASLVSVTFKFINNTVNLKVQDNGIGITKKQINDPNSLGLLGIRERLLPLAGKFNIKGEKDKGTTITVSLPLTGN